MTADRVRSGSEHRRTVRMTELGVQIHVCERLRHEGEKAEQKAELGVQQPDSSAMCLTPWRLVWMSVHWWLGSRRLPFVRVRQHTQRR
jgi:hypothetical protein